MVTADALVVAHLRQQGKEAALRRLGDKELAGHEQENVSQAEEGITTDPSSVQAKIGDLSIDK